MPKRIQMTRQKPWRADNPHAVIVARPGPWGNPFRVGIHGTAEECVARYRDLATGLIDVTKPPCPHYGEQVAAQDHIREQLHTLRGRDLACWCPLDQPCHADVLLELANRPLAAVGE